MDRATTVPTRLSALKRLKPVWVWRASTMPVKMAVMRTTGMELTPSTSICRKMLRTRYGGLIPSRNDWNR